MEIFIEVKSLFRLLGFLRIEHPYSKAINYMQTIVYVCCLTTFTSSSLYFFAIARTFAKRSETFLFFNMAFFLVNLYTIMIYQRKEIITTITLIEEKIQERMCCAIKICCN